MSNAPALTYTVSWFKFKKKEREDLARLLGAKQKYRSYHETSLERDTFFH